MWSATENYLDSKLDGSPGDKVPESILQQMGFCELAEFRAEVRGDSEGCKRPEQMEASGSRTIRFSARAYPIICRARRKAARYFMDMCTSSHFTNIGMWNKSLKLTNRSAFQSLVAYDA